MAKNFGVKMPELFMFDRSPFGCEISYSGKINMQIGSNNSQVRYNIDPDSLHIFHPVEGDIIEFDKRIDNRSTEPNHKLFDELRLDNDHYCEDDGCYDEIMYIAKNHGGWFRNYRKILQRNNKPFIMPQREIE